MTLTTFVTPKFRNEIDNNCLNVFPKLKASDRLYLIDRLSNMINIIAYRLNFNFNERDIYENQFRQNNYRDVTALMFILLPFIDDNETNDNKKMLSSLDEIYTKKTKIVDINKESPAYIYSNVQYGRAIRDNKIEEISFNREFLDHNYCLFLETIHTVSNRLYVNWIDILPVDNLYYKNFLVYRDTLRKYYYNKLVDWNTFENYDINNLDKNTLQAIQGLSMQDIYETIANDFYNNIYKIKWIIYDLIAIIKGEGQQVPMIIALSNILNLNECFNDIDWDGLLQEEQKMFSINWKTFISLTFTDLGFKKGTFALDNMSLKKTAHSLIYMFDSNYDYQGKQEAVKEGYISFNNANEELGLDLDDDEMENIKHEIEPLLQKSLETLPAKHMYTYIQTCLQQFKHTWYSTRLVGIDKNTNEYKIIDYETHLANPLATDQTADIELSLKNVYNFCKSLIYIFPIFSKSRTEKQSLKQFQLQPFWRSLNTEQRTIVISRLNDSNEDNSVMKWFNISRYLIKTYPAYFEKNTKENRKTNEEQLQKFHSDIYKMIKKKLIDFIFESMIKRGVLSQFVPNKEASDDNIISRGSEKRRKLIAEKVSKYINKKSLFYEHSYYYLTGTTYKDMPEMNYEKELMNYFTYNGKDAWYDAYAMNWVSQLNFFHKYLNTRVMYVTGGTGVGKSTQVPKLLLYALKAIDFNDQGKVVCTEPRTVPTTKNSEQISLEMGVPIEVKNKGGDVIHNNYYIQYKYKGNQHMPKAGKNNNLVLKIVTDGSLLQELQGNPILKKNRKDINGTITYYTQNVYDIVIVDESHEHNSNMDMILTLMKTAAQYNNSLKLVMISATMKSDEPYYRRYYRDIDDNRMYPFNMRLQEYEIDRVNVDRRLDISIPGSLATRFKIDEFWMPERKDDAEQLIFEIMTRESTGNLLFFQPGTKEIQNSISILNSVLPSNIIALPLYKDMNKYTKDIVSDIDKHLSNIKIDRNIPFSEFNESLYGIKGGTNTYTRCVIIATNIAEASVTFPLKFVVDTGTQKVMIFDYKKHSTVMKLEYISESSRVQRKGRVGRIGAGSVYYLYPKGTTENVVKQYDISSKDLQLELFDRLYDTYTDKSIFDINNDPNNPNNAHLLVLDIDTISAFYKKDTINGLDKIIMQQYFINNKFYNYFGNSKHYDYPNYETLPVTYKTGMSYDTLNDAKGRFYIIHPDEMNIVRNINGEISGVKDLENLEFKPPTESKYKNMRTIGSIVSKKMMSFWNTLMDNLFISLYKDQEVNKTTKTHLGTNEF